MDGTVLETDRLLLVPGRAELLRVALVDPRALALALGAGVPASWPPEFLDELALEFVLGRILSDPQVTPWWLYFVVRRHPHALEGARDPRGPVLIGTAGFKGPPTGDGSVELGYGIVRDHQRRGYASEAVAALVAWAYRDTRVQRVLAETFPERIASIGVLSKCGFRNIGSGSEPRTVRFEHTRAGRSR
jgi:RimJ/RimL family protein N-acetyltransferase